MIVARSPAELEPAERAIALGTFDGVHRGHRAVIEAVKATGHRSTVLTFDPHPRLVLGYDVQLLSTLERRIELIEEIGPDELLVVEFTQELSRREPEEFVADYLTAVGARSSSPARTFVSVPGGAATSTSCAAWGWTSGRCRSSRASPRAGFAISCARATSSAPQPSWEGPSSWKGTSSTATGAAGRWASRPPTSRLTRTLLVPEYGIYAGEALEHRVAASIGVNPHYGGSERRIEAFLLDFEGDLYGSRLRLELWERLREERAFASEEELVAQIAVDVEAARAASRPG